MIKRNSQGCKLGEDAFFANSEADALAEFSKRAGCNVQKCVYPVCGKRVYCVSTNGQLFGLIPDDSKHMFVGYTRKVHPMHKERERTTPGVWYSVKNYLTGKSTVVRAEKLVYCTFVLGRWDEDVKVQFKDGDQYNISLDNIEAEHDDPLWTENMSEQAQVYRRYFNRVVEYVWWFCKIRKDEAQDCVQDTFLWLTSAEREKPSYFIGAWMFWAKMNGLRYMRNNARLVPIEDWDGYGHEKQVDINILGMIKNEKHRDMMLMKLQGYTEREIAERHGTTRDTVHSTMRWVIANLRKEFIKDFKVLGIKTSAS